MKNDRWGDKFVAHSTARSITALHVRYNRSALSHVLSGFIAGNHGFVFFLNWM